MQRSFNCALEQLSNVFHCPQELTNKLIECAHPYSTPLEQFLSHYVGLLGPLVNDAPNFFQLTINAPYRALRYFQESMRTHRQRR